jgi:selenocysteine lyase/cysteine desulfurase
MPGWYGTISLGDLDAQKYEQIEFSRGEASMLAEVGTPSVLSYVGVTAGMKMIQEVGPENIFKRISDLTQYGIERVTAIGRRVFTPLDRERRAGEIVIQLKPGEDAPTIAGELDSKKKIKVEALTDTDAGLRLGPQWKGGAINFQPTFYNTEDEIDYFVKALGAY